jgi:DNA-binding PadR family transcriptional regulator
MDTVFSNPGHLYSRAEVLSNPCPVPRAHGVYAFFFKEIPPGVPVDGCLNQEGLTLLYIGISPDKKGSANATQTLQQRVRYHFNGNADGSTLRRSLGILLEKKSGFPLRMVGSGKKMTLTSEGEEWLNRWMQENAFLTWVENENPWDIENELFHARSLPLNIQGNKHNRFAAELTRIRMEAIANAKYAPAVEKRAPEN